MSGKEHGGKEDIDYRVPVCPAWPLTHESPPLSYDMTGDTPITQESLLWSLLRLS